MVGIGKYRVRECKWTIRSGRHRKQCFLGLSLVPCEHQGTVAYLFSYLKPREESQPLIQPHLLGLSAYCQRALRPELLTILLPGKTFLPAYLDPSQTKSCGSGKAEEGTRTSTLTDPLRQEVRSGGDHGIETLEISLPTDSNHPRTSGWLFWIALLVAQGSRYSLLESARAPSSGQEFRRPLPPEYPL